MAFLRGKPKAQRKSAFESAGKRIFSVKRTAVRSPPRVSRCRVIAVSNKRKSRCFTMKAPYSRFIILSAVIMGIFIIFILNFSGQKWL